MQTRAPFHIVLIEPEIPPNTGNIGRLCAATGTHLHLVGKLGFSLDDKHMKRAGLDYWPEVKLHLWESLHELQQTYPQGRFWYTSKKAQKSYINAEFNHGDFLVFGKETLGLPEELLEAENDHTLLIPIFSSAVRSLNLANSASIILYEALRQTGQLDQ
ncbi:tRNA (cytidine(34)-2'-O)-methyltransferase [uncultured Desulfuromusa sp.]|uniref:tRNA (cytidine(34)-2'-O)-methyltransferase n=1 Tax=uncultured Desulfuromusa sp. TaxID=219183 RepID=UPI002AA67E5B|nr:tRNA (cytidine(34)-2'-O)-methyltransferase [uncultured Desulfuromusa sp.]